MVLIIIQAAHSRWIPEDLIEDRSWRLQLCAMQQKDFCSPLVAVGGFTGSSWSETFIRRVYLDK